MTSEQQRIAIAEACGWKPHHEKGGTDHWEDFWEGWNPKGAFCLFEDLPDYLNDLNSMNDAEKVLQDKCLYWPDYIDELSKLFRVGFPQQDATNWSQMAHASASQRATAFLKTLGKWIEEPKS